METDKPYPIASRAASLVLFTLLATWSTRALRAHLMERLQAMSAPELLAYEEKVHGHSFPVDFIVLFVFGIFCFVSVEVLAYLLRSVRQPKKDA